MLNVLLCNVEGGKCANDYTSELSSYWAHWVAGSRGGDVKKWLKMTILCICSKYCFVREGGLKCLKMNQPFIFVHIYSMYCFVREEKTFRKHDSRCHVGSMLHVLFCRGRGGKSVTMTQHVNFLHMLIVLLCMVEGGKCAKMTQDAKLLHMFELLFLGGRRGWTKLI
jgi:hypothetical protein